MTSPALESPDVRVDVAELAVATDGTLSSIGLGSCVAIVLHDPVARVGGLAHVLLPHESMARDRSNPAKFPATAVPLLVETMVARGARRDRVAAKIVGGASMFDAIMPAGGIRIGQRNVAAVREALAAAGLRIVAEDIGSVYGRSVRLRVRDGRVEVRSLKRGIRVL
jgi:chemotaxis protein CheD